MKKVLKNILKTSLGATAIVALGSYFRYHSYWAKDPDVEIENSNLSYYHETYKECRKAFKKSIKEIEPLFDQMEKGKIHVPGINDDDLTIDWCYIPAHKKKEKLLIINSGLHGIEGFTGSAVQLMFIDKLLKQSLPANMGVLLIHGLNPYGFKHRRKVTENNIDLNRNCLYDGQKFAIKNTGYSELTDLLMPSNPVDIKNLNNQFFYLTAINKIIKESMPVLRQAALQGQYDYKKGIYYGGKAFEPQIDSLKPFLIKKMSAYNMILNLDLHTGYGERGNLHLFIDKPEDQMKLKGIEKIFNSVHIDWGENDNFYTINGEYIEWVNNLIPQKLTIPMLFEFGTMDTQKMFGSLKSMQIMILENQGAQYGYKNKQNESKIKMMFDEMYYPSSPVWRSKVISDAYKIMSLMIKNYDAYEVEQKEGRIEGKGRKEKYKV